jgi:hypothetical protein
MRLGDEGLDEIIDRPALAGQIHAFAQVSGHNSRAFTFDL